MVTCFAGREPKKAHHCLKCGNQPSVALLRNAYEFAKRGSPEPSLPQVAALIHCISCQTGGADFQIVGIFIATILRELS